MLNSPVLVLNTAYEPVAICSVKKAVTLVFKGAAAVEANSGRVLRAARMTFPRPSVIRLLTYRHLPRRANVVSRRNILIRDRFACQYCKKVLPAAGLTLDHVIPRSRGGASDWGNMVACCYACNNKKGSRTPEEAGLTLPKRSIYSIHTSRHLVRQAGEDNELWRPYLFY